MTHQTTQSAGAAGSRETRAKPPPPVTGRVETPLFQSMDELQSRHGVSPAARERLYLWGGGLLLGALVFGALYLAILFLE